MQDTHTHTAPGAEHVRDVWDESLIAELVSLAPEFSWDDVEDESERSRLRALVPSPELCAAYVPRDTDGVADLVLLAHALGDGDAALLEGPTGTGKSLAPRVLAAFYGLPFVAVAVNPAFDPTTVAGRWILTADKSLEWVPSNVALVWSHFGVIVWDEMNMIPEDGAAALHEPFSDSRSFTVMENGGDVIRLSRATLNVATMNPRYKGTRPLTPALRRRFSTGAVYGYSREIERELVDSPALLEFAFSLREDGDISTDVATPSLLTFERHARSVSLRFAVGRFLLLFANETERRGVALALELVAPDIAAELGVNTEDAA